jgi:hypothetical protein
VPPSAPGICPVEYIVSEEQRLGIMGRTSSLVFSPPGFSYADFQRKGQCLLDMSSASPRRNLTNSALSSTLVKP